MFSHVVSAPPCRETERQGPIYVRTLLHPDATGLTANIRHMHDCVRALIHGNYDFLLCFAYPSIPILLDPARYPHQ